MRDRTLTLLTVAAIFVMSLLAAIILFGFMDSYATTKGTMWTLGGAVAGFAIVFWQLFRAVLRLEKRRTMLTSPQCISLVQLYEKALICELLQSTLRLLDFQQRGVPLLEKNRIKEIAKGIRTRTRELTSCFNTPLGNLNDFLFQIYEPYFNVDFETTMDIVLADGLDTNQKVTQVIELFNARANNMLRDYKRAFDRA